MRPYVAVIYNDPIPARYAALGEAKAVVGVLEEMEAVVQALQELGYPFIKVPLRPPLEDARATLKELGNIDLVFNLFEGFDSCAETEAIVTGMLEELKLPFTGCPASALALALDKPKTKALLEAAGISTPRFQALSPETVDSFELTFPCILKPSNEHASHGLSAESVVSDRAALARQVSKISQLFGGIVLAEEFLDGLEFNAIVMGNKELTVLPASEIVYSLPANMPPILTFEAKWEEESLYFRETKVVCPARIDDAGRGRIAEIAKAAYRLIGCRCYARVDMREDRHGRLNVLEVNPNPDISPGSGGARQAIAAGMTYAQFIEQIVLLALEK